MLLSEFGNTTSPVWLSIEDVTNFRWVLRISIWTWEWFLCICALVHSLSHSLAHSLTHARTHTHTHTLTNTSDFKKCLDKKQNKLDIIRDVFSQRCESYWAKCLWYHQLFLLPGVRNWRALRMRTIPQWLLRQSSETWCAARHMATSTLSSSQCSCEWCQHSCLPVRQGWDWSQCFSSTTDFLSLLIVMHFWQSYWLAVLWYNNLPLPYW